MNNIVLTRIDDRLIHGQVMTSWLNFTGANRIIVVDDQVAKDSFMKMILSSAVPGNISVDIFSIEEASSKIKDDFKESDKIIILAKYPKTILSLIEHGLQIKKLNVGGMGASSGRKNFYKNISASEEEKEIFKKIIDAGCEIYIQIIAEGQEIDLSKLL